MLLFFLMCTNRNHFSHVVFAQVISRNYVVDLRRVIAEITRVHQEETLQEKAAYLLTLPQRLEAINAKLCQSLERLQLPAFEPAQGTTHLTPATLKDPKTHLLCTLTSAVSGEIMGEFYAEKNQPWLDAVPFGQVCHVWQLTNFNLMQGSDVIFPCSRLSKMVPANVYAMELQVVRRQDIPPVHVKMVVGKGCLSTRDYQPQAGTAPLYEFCELQTLLLAEADGKLLRDLEFRTPEGPMAKKLLNRFHEILRANPKIGKRKLGEFRRDEHARSYIIHVLVSSDGQDLCLRAKLVYEAPYVVVSVSEKEGAASPWDKKSYVAVCQAIVNARVWNDARLMEETMQVRLDTGCIRVAPRRSLGISTGAPWLTFEHLPRKSVAERLLLKEICKLLSLLSLVRYLFARDVTVTIGFFDFSSGSSIKTFTPATELCFQNMFFYDLFMMFFMNAIYVFLMIWF